MSDSPKRTKLSRPIKLLIWSAAVVLTYTIVGFLVVPAIIKSQMLKRLPPIVFRQVAVQKVAVNPFTLALTVRGLSMTESNGEAFAGFEQLHVQFQAMLSLSRHAWVFQDVTLTNLSAHIVRRKDGGFNFDNILQGAPAAAHPAAPAPPQPLPAVIVESLRVDGVDVLVDDLTPEVPFHDKLDPINLQVAGFTTRTNISSPFSLSVTTDAGESIAVSGNVTVQPLQTSGRVKLSGLDLKRYAPYLAAFTSAEVLDGKLDAGADYAAALGPKGLDATVTNGTALLSALRVKAPDTGETVVSIPSLSVDLAGANLANQTVRINSIKSAGGALLVRQNRDGTINLLALLKNPPASAATPAAPAAVPWTAQVDEIAFDSYTVEAEDQTPAHPVKIGVTDLAFKINGFSTASNAPISTTLSMRLNGQGSLAISGKGTAIPPGGDIQLDLAGLDLPPFQPYLAGKVNLALTAGRLDVHGRARYTPGGGGPLASFTGEVAVTNLATADSAHFRDLVKFASLAVKGIDAAFLPDKLHVGEIDLAGLSATIILDTNRQPNVLSIIPPQPKVPAAPASAPAASPAMPVSLDALVLENASLHFIDQSIEPNCAFDVLDFGGAIKGLSLTGQGPATVDLQGKVDQFSSFSVTGTVNPADASLNLAVSMKNFELTPFTPYMERYGGYPLNKGKLLLDLQYAIAQRKLAASNKVVIADLTLGQKNTSPDAVHLPIKLGIALLKDRGGKIDLDVPVSGSLDDPNFKIGPIVWKVIRNLLEKAATSPFTLLGKVLGGGGEELSYVEFPPGTATIADAEEGKVQKLAKALYERPALNLQIAGSADSLSDRPMLARAHLERRVKAERARELTAAGQPAEAVDSMIIDPADYARLLQVLYQRTFPTNTAAVPASTNTASAASPAAPTLVYVPPDEGGAPAEAHPFAKGGERLMNPGASSAPKTPRAGVQQAQASKAGPTPSAASPAGGLPPGAPDVAQMEQRLIEQITVTDDEMRELMQARAKAVQKALLDSGKVEPGRLFILAPKPVDTAAKGEARANLSLE
jgi:uncharacterized protein involved in outer membrane biogenesis